MIRIIRPIGSTRIHRCSPTLVYRKVKTGPKRADWRYEHRVVMEQHLGRNLSSLEFVHHKNGNTLDNRIENLEVMSRPDHVSHHFSIDTWAKDFDKCRRCGTQEERHAARGLCILCYNGRVKKAGEHTYHSLGGLHATSQ